MRKKLFASVGVVFILSSAKAQGGHTGTTGDMRNFASQTSVVVQRTPFSNQKSNTIGSQFLFKDWATGMVTNKEGVSFSGGLFNYDKINKNLYILKDDTTFLINKFQLQTIRLHDLADSNTRYVLEKIPSLKTDDLYFVVAKGNKYSLVKEIRTKFIAADYQSNGIVSSGNMYDEFKDEYKYYIIFPNGSAHDVSLKKKSIKNALEAEKDKVEQFYKANPDEDQTENFLSRLITSLN
jgi:hypothetical protein